MFPSKKKLTLTDARQRIFRYCAYQERCHQEVKNKLFELGVSKSDSDVLVTELITEGYLNEERFAKAFAGGKFRIKKWGRNKIVNELELKGLTPYCIKSGLKEIDDAEYLKALTEILGRKSELLPDENTFIKKDKLAKFAIQKGFEPELVWRVLKGELGSL